MLNEFFHSRCARRSKVKSSIGPNTFAAMRKVEEDYSMNNKQTMLERTIADMERMKEKVAHLEATVLAMLKVKK